MWSKMLKCLQRHKWEHRDVILVTCFLDPETEEQHFALQITFSELDAQVSSMASIAF